MIFTSRGFPCSGPLRATFWTGAWLVLVFGPKFPENLDQNLARPAPKKLRQGWDVSFGSDWSLFPPLARLAFWRTCIQRLAGHVAGWWCWLASYIANTSSYVTGGWLAMWLYCCQGSWLAMCWFGGCLAMRLRSHEAGLPTGDVAGYVAGWWLTRRLLFTWLAVKWLAG